MTAKDDKVIAYTAQALCKLRETSVSLSSSLLGRLRDLKICLPRFRKTKRGCRSGKKKHLRRLSIDQSSLEDSPLYQSLYQPTPTASSSTKHCTINHSNLIQISLDNTHTHHLKQHSLNIRQLKILNINCNGLKSGRKKRLLHALLEQEKPDIVLGIESHINASFKDSEIFPPTYLAKRNDRDVHGGGVFIAHRDTINLVEIENVGNNCELKAAKIISNTHPTLCLVVYYRPPNDRETELLHFQRDLEKIISDNQKANIILGGDFNVPSINWDTCTINENPQYGYALNEKLLCILSNQFLTQMVNEPTRGDNILDLMFVSAPDLIEDVRTTCGISDHQAVTAIFKHKTDTNQKQRRKIYMYGKVDKEVMGRHLQHMVSNYNNGANERNVDENWTWFTNTLSTIVDQHVPKKTSKRNNDLPYITRGIKRQMRVRKRRWDRFRKTRRREDLLKYETAKQQVKKSLDEEYLKYLDGMFDETRKGTKKLWSFVKSKKKDRIGIPALLSDSKLVTSAQEKAEVLATQYESVFTKEQLDQMPDKGMSPFPVLKDIVFSKQGVVKLLKAQDPTKAVGPDQVPTVILKEYADVLSPLVTDIFTRCLESGDVPLDWLDANITGIYKKGSKVNPANYRPVSLTCVTCKIMEHIIFTSIMEHVEKHHVLKHYQHGFRKGHSCVSQLLNTVEEISRELDAQNQNDVLILDFAKAFDTVPHQRLLYKLDYYGIRGNTLRWIENWLTQRHQTVVIDGAKSRRVQVISGVPQGTVLGPLLFLLYINDIGDSISSPIRLFADDSLLYRRVNNANDALKLQQDLDRIVKWSDTWQMQFNPSKCTVLRVTRKHAPIKHDYTMMGTTLCHVNHYPYLGVELTSDLSWSLHIDNITNKANRSLNFIRRNLHDCPQYIKEKAYQSFVRPNIEYASSVWDPYLKKDCQSLDKIQRKAARFVTSSYRREDSVGQMLQSLGWQSLGQRRFIERQTILWKARHDQVAVPIPSYITTHTRKTRENNSQALVNLSTRTDQYKYSFFPRTIRCWNLLPEHVVTATSAEHFRCSIWPEVGSGAVVVLTPGETKLTLGRSDGQITVT